MPNIRIIIADDHRVFAEGLHALLDTQPHFEVVGMYASGLGVLEHLKNNPADVLFSDISMPEINGLELCESIKRKYPSLKVIALTMHDDPVLAKRMLRKGADGFLLKNTSKQELLEAIEQVLKGQTYVSEPIGQWLHEEPPKPPKKLSTVVTTPHLTKREKEVLRLVADGKTAVQIAEQLYVTPKAVEFHKSSLLAKFGVQNTAHLIRLAVEFQFID